MVNEGKTPYQIYQASQQSNSSNSSNGSSGYSLPSGFGSGGSYQSTQSSSPQHPSSPYSGSSGSGGSSNSNNSPQHPSSPYNPPQYQTPAPSGGGSGGGGFSNGYSGGGPRNNPSYSTQATPDQLSQSSQQLQIASGQISSQLPKSELPAGFGSSIKPLTVGTTNTILQTPYVPEATKIISSSSPSFINPLLSVSPAVENLAFRIAGTFNSGAAPIIQVENKSTGYIVRVNPDSQVNQNTLDAFENIVNNSKKFYNNENVTVKKLDNKTYFISEKSTPSSQSNIPFLGGILSPVSPGRPAASVPYGQYQSLAPSNAELNAAAIRSARSENIFRDVPFIGEAGTTTLAGLKELSYNLEKSAQIKSSGNSPFGKNILSDITGITNLQEGAKILGVGGEKEGYIQNVLPNALGGGLSLYSLGYTAGTVAATGATAASIGSLAPLGKLGLETVKLTGFNLGIQGGIKGAEDIVTGKSIDLAPVFSGENIANVAVLSPGLKPFEFSVGKGLAKSVSSGAVTGGLFGTEIAATTKSDEKPILESAIGGAAFGAVLGGGLDVLGNIGSRVVNKISEVSIKNAPVSFEVSSPVTVYETGQGTYFGESIGSGKATIKTRLGSREVPLKSVKSEVGFLDVPTGGAVYSGDISVQIPTGKTFKTVTTPISGFTEARPSTVEGTSLLEGVFQSGKSTGKISGQSIRSFESGTTSAETAYYNLNLPKGDLLKRSFERGSKTGQEFIISDPLSQFQEVGQRQTFDITIEGLKSGNVKNIIGKKSASALDIEFLEPSNLDFTSKIIRTSKERNIAGAVLKTDTSTILGFKVGERNFLFGQPKSTELTKPSGSSPLSFLGFNLKISPEEFRLIKEPTPKDIFSGDAKQSFKETLFIKSPTGEPSTLIKSEGLDFRSYVESAQKKLPLGDKKVNLEKGPYEEFINTDLSKEFRPYKKPSSPRQLEGPKLETVESLVIKDTKIEKPYEFKDFTSAKERQRQVQEQFTKTKESLSEKQIGVEDLLSQNEYIKDTIRQETISRSKVDFRFDTKTVPFIQSINKEATKQPTQNKLQDKFRQDFIDSKIDLGDKVNFVALPTINLGRIGSARVSSSQESGFIASSISSAKVSTSQETGQIQKTIPKIEKNEESGFAGQFNFGYIAPPTIPRFDFELGSSAGGSIGTKKGKKVEVFDLLRATGNVGKATKVSFNPSNIKSLDFVSIKEHKQSKVKTIGNLFKKIK